MIWRLALFALAAALSACGDKGEQPPEKPAAAKTSELWSLRSVTLNRDESSSRQELVAGRLSERAAIDVVGDDEWSAEKILREIEAELAKLKRREPPRLAAGFEGSPLLPREAKPMEPVIGFSSVKIAAESQEVIRESEFGSELDRLLQRFPRVSFKVIGVEDDDAGVRTDILVTHWSEGGEAHARWSCEWDRGADGLELRRLRRSEYSEIEVQYPSRMFADFTSAVIDANGAQFAQIVHGIPTWTKQITRFGDLALTGHHGLAVGDVDGDGREDLFVADGGSLPNRLYRQREDGTAEEIARQAGVAWLEDSRAALLVDLDNDGDQDLAVATIAMIAFAENDGSGKFALRGGFPRAQYPFSMAAADYDLDGDLDIYVCVYGEGDQATAERGFAAQAPVPYDDAQNGGRNVLLENLGGFGFADVTDEAGLDDENSRWSFAAAWEDYDGDGDADLYVANDFGRNCLYRNEGGRFEEVASEQGVADLAAGMSVSWGDYNRDGKPDLYVGNMFSSAGSRLSGLGGFAPGSSAERRAGLRRMAQGNSLFAGGDDGFAEVPGAAGAAMGRWAWSSGFADINNDGWEDLVVANGYLTGWEGDGDL